MLELNAKFEELFGQGNKPKQFFCPGRVNLIGEHIDYLGGLVMPAAISLGITGIFRPTESNTIRLASTSFEGISEFNLENLHNEKQGQWTDYVIGVINSIQNEGITIGGFNLLLDSTLPKGSGLSSSAALEVLIYYSLHSLFGASEPDRTEMAVACQRVENDFVGVQCGIMDQFAVANGKVDYAMMLNCDSLEFNHVPFDLGDYSLVIINSKKPRELADSAYNQRLNECSEALGILQSKRPETKELVQASLEDVGQIPNPTIRNRSRHAVTEQQRVLEAKKALASLNIAKFGTLLNASHESLKTDYEVSCAELDYIVDFLTNSEHCAGARMTGAGFGGCCIALIATNHATELCRQLKVAYSEAFKLDAEWFICQTADGVHSVA